MDDKCKTTRRSFGYYEGNNMNWYEETGEVSSIKVLQSSMMNTRGIY